MIYASFCFNNPQNVLGSRGSACTARSDTQLIVGSCNFQSSSRARIDRARRLYTGCGSKGRKVAGEARPHRGIFNVLSEEKGLKPLASLRTRIRSTLLTSDN